MQINVYNSTKRSSRENKLQMKKGQRNTGSISLFGHFEFGNSNPAFGRRPLIFPPVVLFFSLDGGRCVITVPEYITNTSAIY